MARDLKYSGKNFCNFNRAGNFCSSRMFAILNGKKFIKEGESFLPKAFEFDAVKQCHMMSLKIVKKI